MLMKITGISPTLFYVHFFYIGLNLFMTGFPTSGFPAPNTTDSTNQLVIPLCLEVGAGMN